MQRLRGETLSVTEPQDKIVHFREKTALWYVDPNNQETRLSYESLSLASQKAANAIQGLGAKRAVCILPRVRIFLVVKYGD